MPIRTISVSSVILPARSRAVSIAYPYLNIEKEFYSKSQLSLSIKPRFSKLYRHHYADSYKYSGLNLNQDKATKPQTVQIVRQGEATPYWFKVNPL